MADPIANKATASEFVFRRLSEAFPLSTPDASLLWYCVAAGVLAFLAIANFVHVLFPSQKAKGGSFFGALLAAFGSMFVGKVDSGRATFWHYVAAGLRSALFAWPLAFLLISRQFEADSEPVWWAFTGGMLFITAALTAMMYFRDAKTCGWWAVPLTLLRVAVLAILAFCFLLPAIQTYEDTEKRSRVVLVLDLSPSMFLSDEASLDSNAKLKSRMDTVIEFLTSDIGGKPDAKVTFLTKLLEKNPIQVYRFGSRLDDEPGAIGLKDEPWGKAEWESFVKYDFKPVVLKALSAGGQKAVAAASAWGTEPGTADWFLGWSKAANADSGFEALSADDKSAFEKARTKLEKRVDLIRTIASGTAVADSLTAVVNREATNMTQGVVVFSDGRSNIGSDSAFVELAKRAKEASIPIFTVAVGEAREIVELNVSDLQVPDRAMPDEPAQISVGVDGKGFKEGDDVEVILELFLPGTDPKKDSASHEMRKPLKFAAGDPPHGEVTFTLDPEKHASADKEAFQGEHLPRGLVDDAPPTKIGRKYMLKQGPWNVRAKVAKHPKELFRDPFHFSPVRPMQVIDKPLRILLVTSGPSREYQTLRSLLVRETDQKRAELTIYLQNEGGIDGTIVQDIEPGRLLQKFPDELEANRKAVPIPEGDPAGAIAAQRTRFNNLDEFDVIVAFDPNWNERDKSSALRIPNTAFKNIEKFVAKFGGGLVYVAGPFYTPQLARNDEESGRLRPIINVLPVYPDDLVATEDELLKLRLPKVARRLKMTPTTEADLLRLDDETTLSEPDRATAGWELFFTGREKFAPSTVPGEDLTPKRGFFTYYPVKGTKPGVKPLAEFLNVDAMGQEAKRTYYATTQVEVGRSAWIGSGEIYRLRAASPGYYERFWLKLLRYCAAKRTSGAKARGQVLMGKEFTAGGQIRVQTRVLQANGDAYPENEIDKPKFTIKQFDQNGNMVKEHGPFDVLKPTKLGAKFEGYYKGAVTADLRKFPVDGKYKISVTKSDLPEPLEAEFVLKSSNPELDNTKPDFVAMQNAATNLKDVLDRIPDPSLRLQVSNKLGGGGRAADEAKAKLAYRLNETEKLLAIPDCIQSKTAQQRDRGLVDDLWDDDWTPEGHPLSNSLRTQLVPNSPVRLWMPVVGGLLILVSAVWIIRSRLASPALGIVFTLLLLVLLTATAAAVYFGNPFPVGIAIFAVAGLLALEWTTRKLIRLA